jgi:pSer/pThr/pTyr-binding forkhead associated (FHA) protein
MAPEAPGEASSAPAEVPAEHQDAVPEPDSARQPQLDIRHRYRVEIEADRGVEQYPLESGSLYIGRLPTNDVVLNDKTVSRRHLHIFVEDGEIVAQDLESTNPSLLNGRPLRGRTALKEGDELRVRSARVRLVPVGLYEP